MKVFIDELLWCLIISGVPREVVAFGNAVQSGKAEPYASALEGLIDVSLVCTTLVARSAICILSYFLSD